MKKILLPLVWILLWFTHTGNAQKGIQIRESVVDSNTKEPLSFASVALLQEDKGPTLIRAFSTRYMINRWHTK